MMPAMINASTHHQNSARLARPVKVAYFDRTVRTASFMAIPLRCGESDAPAKKRKSLTRFGDEA
jgi:hypothetical protein